MTIMQQIKASLARLARALEVSDVPGGQSDLGSDLTFEVYQQEMAHAGVGVAGWLLLGWLGLPILIAVQARQVWRERRLLGRVARIRDAVADGVVIAGCGMALMLPDIMAGLAVVGIAGGRALVRDIRVAQALEGPDAV